jgi:hypothetical protein
MPNEIDSNELCNMDPNIAERWIAALESGDYKQGANRLHYMDAEGSKFCCLGVLCDLAVKAGVTVSYEVPCSIHEKQADGSTKKINTTQIEYGEEVDRSGFGLPRSVSSWARISGDGTRWVFTSSVDGLSLSELNDNGATFKTIAGLIRQAIEPKDGS